MRRPTGAVARQAPHARRKLPVHRESLKTSALRPYSPHSAHGARAQLGLSSTVRIDGPAPGCPSDASSAVHEPVCASCAARQPTQRARRASPVRRLDDCSFEAIARLPNARHPTPVPYVSPSAPSMRPVSYAARTAGEHSSASRRQMFDAIAWRPNARLTISSELFGAVCASREARQPRQRARRAEPRSVSMPTATV